MPNDIANNMADTIHKLEEENIMLSTQLTDLQLAYNDQMLELRQAKELLKAAVEGLDNCSDRCICDYCDSRCPFYSFGCVSAWKYRAEALALIGEVRAENG